MLIYLFSISINSYFRLRFTKITDNPVVRKIIAAGMTTFKTPVSAASSVSTALSSRAQRLYSVLNVCSFCPVKSSVCTLSNSTELQTVPKITATALKSTTPEASDPRH